MAWYLALQGPSQMAHQSSVYELQDGADVEKIAQEMTSSATLNRAVPIPAVLAPNHQRQQVILYVRPAAWAVWTFYQQSEEDRRQLVEQINTLSQAMQRAQTTGPSAQMNPPTGHLGPGTVRTV